MLPASISSTVVVQGVKYVYDTITKSIVTLPNVKVTQHLKIVIDKAAQKIKYSYDTTTSANQ